MRHLRVAVVTASLSMIPVLALGQTPDLTPTPAPTPTPTPTPAPGSGAASATPKPTPKASGGVGKVWSWKVSGHTVHVQSGAIKVDGNVPEDVVREAMDHDGWEYARCYEQVFKTADSMPHGTVTLTFKIFDQLPRNAAIEKSDFTVPAFNECVKNTALGQTANAAGASGFATVTYPLIFTVAD